VKVTSFRGVAEHLFPCRLLHAAFCLNRIENLLELALNFFIVERLVQQSADGMFSLNKWLAPVSEYRATHHIPHRSYP
jgi:hypothetical protein